MTDIDKREREMYIHIYIYGTGRPVGIIRKSKVGECVAVDVT